MNKVKEKIIHWLGGFTKKEYDDMQALSNSALAKLTESHDALQVSLRALEHAVENSRATGVVNFVKVEKPIKIFNINEIISQEPSQTEEEQIVYAKRNISKQFGNILLKNDLIDFKISSYDFDKRITGTIYVREP